MKPICIDANVFIASTKSNEPYSSHCKRVIQVVADGEFYLIEPTICLTEVIRNITKYLGMEAGKTQENNLRRMVSLYGKHVMTISAPVPDILGRYTEPMQRILFISKRH